MRLSHRSTRSATRLFPIQSFRVLLIGAVFALTAASALAMVGAMGIPIVSTPSPTSLSGGSTLTYSVTVNQVPSGGCTVWVNTSRPDLFTSPSGSWPYSLSFPNGGSATQSMKVTTSSVHSNCSGAIGSCESDYSPSDQGDWQVTSTVTVTPN